MVNCHFAQKSEGRMTFNLTCENLGKAPATSRVVPRSVHGQYSRLSVDFEVVSGATAHSLVQYNLLVQARYVV